MLFGRTLYGGALYPRQVTAAGSAACSASVSARQKAAYLGGAGIAATATVNGAEAIRNVLPVALPSGVAAGVSARARVDFALAASLSSGASVFGRPRVDFSALAEAVSAALGSAKIIRTIVQRIPSRTNADATPEAQAQVYVYVSPGRVMCYANPFGTHWFVGYGACTARATGAASAAIIRAAHGGGVASGTPGGRARADMHGAGAALSAGAASVDPLLTVGGVRYWDANAEARADALLTGAAYTYSVVLAVGRATVVDGANSHRAAAGTARCFGEARGSMERVQPEYSSVVISSRAQGGARAHVGALAKANTQVTGAATATPKVVAAGRGASGAVAAGTSNVVWLSSRAGESAAIAMAKAARAFRVCIGRGAASSSSAGAGTGRAVSQLSGTSSGLAVLAASGGLHPKVFAAGALAAEAQLTGVNKTNDSVQQLSSRVINVAREGRTIPVNEPPRVIAVQGASRRLAA